MEKKELRFNWDKICKYFFLLFILFGIITIILIGASIIFGFFKLNHIAVACTKAFLCTDVIGLTTLFIGGISSLFANELVFGKGENGN